MEAPPGWSVLAASVAGSSHLREGRECEDAHDVCHLGGGQICVAVADGAGSARFGGLGAATAVAAATGAVRESLSVSSPTTDAEWANLMNLAFASALQAIHERSDQESTDAIRPTVADFACTLLLVIAGPAWTIGAQVGDGLTAVEEGQAMNIFTGPDRGEYLNETTFLTSARYRDTLRV